MKTTKRILAIITALVLCLTPMALMIGAAESAHCSHLNTYINTSTAATAYQIASATSTHCPTIKYVGCIKVCRDCDEYLGTEDITHAFTHYWVDDVCSYCGYER